MSVQRRNQLLALSGGLTGILAASGYILYYQSQKQEAERLEAARRHPYRYRLPLRVPEGPAFRLDDLNETYCLEFFRYDFQRI
jgi:hypothetical protein